jgi:hypothetical protein
MTFLFFITRVHSMYVCHIYVCTDGSHRVGSTVFFFFCFDDYRYPGTGYLIACQVPRSLLASLQKSRDLRYT